MAVGKEIRTKIAIIKNTQKITRAMEMVAASKMRRTKDRMQASRPYSQKMRQIINHLAHANPEYKHALMAQRDPRRVGVIVIGSDRGLCGGLNANLFRTLLMEIQKWKADNLEIDACAIGSKAAGFLCMINTNLMGHIAKLGDTPHQHDIAGITKIMLDAFSEGKIDRLFVIYNEFVNTMTQKPVMQQLLPVVAEETSDVVRGRWDYLYEPGAKEVLDQLLIRYVESIVYQGVVENNACEQAARMVAMKSASDNAGNIIKELQLVYNKARQAAITQEISEIVAGAAAV